MEIKGNKRQQIKKGNQSKTKESNGSVLFLGVQKSYTRKLPKAIYKRNSKGSKNQQIDAKKAIDKKK